jgi:hypothetical protein
MDHVKAMDLDKPLKDSSEDGGGLVFRKEGFSERLIII